MALHHPQGVGFHVFARHKPRRMVAPTALRAFFFDATYAQALALTQGVKTQALVFANLAALVGFDRARCFGDISV
jgi:hypothetical protein